MKYELLLALLFFSFCACNVNVNLAKRYKNGNERFKWLNDNDVKKYVSIDFSSFLVSNSVTVIKTSDSKTFFDLSPEAQKTLINVSNTRAGTGGNYDEIVTDIRKILGPKRPIPPAPLTTVKFISPVIKKSFQFKIQKGWFTPTYKYDANKKIEKEYRYFGLQGERINYLELTLNTPPDQIIFSSWDKYVSNLAILDLGKVSAAQTWNASMNLSNTAVATSGDADTYYDETSLTSSSSLSNAEKTNTSQSGEGLKTTNTNVANRGNSLTTGLIGSLSYNDKYETSQNLSNRILALSGLLKPDQLTITQEGGPGIDLSGIINVGVELVYKGDLAQTTFAKFEKFFNGLIHVPENNLTFSTTTVYFPDIKKDIMGNIKYKYLYRKITRGSAHIPEARQKINYLYGQLGYKKDTTWYNIDYLNSLELSNHGLDPMEVELLKKDEFKPLSFHFKNASGNIVRYNGNDLNFETIEDATKLMQYLQELLRGGASSAMFSLGGTGLTYANLSTLTLSH